MMLGIQTTISICCNIKNNWCQMQFFVRLLHYCCVSIGSLFHFTFVLNQKLNNLHSRTDFRVTSMQLSYISQPAQFSFGHATNLGAFFWGNLDHIRVFKSPRLNFSVQRLNTFLEAHNLTFYAVLLYFSKCHYLRIKMLRDCLK